MRFTINPEDYSTSESSSSISPLNSLSSDENYSSEAFSFTSSLYSTDLTYHNLQNIPQAHSVSSVRQLIIEDAEILQNDIEQARPYANYDEESSISTENSGLYSEFKNKYFTYFILFLIWLIFIINCIINNSINNGYDHFKVLAFKTIKEYPSCDSIRYQFWNLFTNSIIHGNLSHILGNTIFLLIFGLFIESIAGYKLIALYFFSGVFGGTLSMAYINRFIFLIGASHGIMALNGSILGLALLNYDILNTKMFFAICIVGTIGLVIDVINHELFYKNNIGYLGHWMGYTNGLLLSVYFSKIFQKRKWKTYLKITSLNIFIALNFFLLFDYCYHEYKINIMDDTFQKIEFHNCCLDYIKSNFRANFTCSYQ